PSAGRGQLLPAARRRSALRRPTPRLGRDAAGLEPRAGGERRNDAHRLLAAARRDRVRALTHAQDASLASRACARTAPRRSCARTRIEPGAQTGRSSMRLAFILFIAALSIAALGRSAGAQTELTLPW